MDTIEDNVRSRAHVCVRPGHFAEQQKVTEHSKSTLRKIKKETTKTHDEAGRARVLIPDTLSGRGTSDGLASEAPPLPHRRLQPDSGLRTTREMQANNFQAKVRTPMFKIIK